MHIKPGLRVISLNSNYYDGFDIFAYDPLHEDPAGQFVWTRKVLESAKNNSEKVVIIGHIAPGGRTSDASPMSTEKYSRFYNEIIEEFGDIIVLNLFGHSHYDELRVVTKGDDGKTPLSTIYLTSSMTSWEKQNPSLRFFNYSDTTFEIESYHHYYADIGTQPTDGSELQWKFLYEPKSAYGMSDLSRKKKKKRHFEKLSELARFSSELVESC